MAAYESQPRIQLLLEYLDIKTPEVTEVEIEPEEEEKPHQAFTLFPFLPRELRDTIWKFALPGPQILEIEVNHGAGARMINFHFPNNPNWRPVQALHGHFNAKSGSKLPGVLFACHESRAIAIRAYSRCFTYIPVTTSRYEELADAKVIPLTEIAMPGISFQPSVDTIYIKDLPNAVPDMLEESVAQELSVGDIRSVAMDYSLFARTVLWSRCFSAVPEYTGDILQPTGVSYTARPWFDNVDEVICLVPARGDPMQAFPGVVDFSKASIEQQFRERDPLKKLPSISTMTFEEFQNLSRWKK